MREPIYQVVMVATVKYKILEEKFPHVKKVICLALYPADISADQSKLKGIAHLGEVWFRTWGSSENDLEMLSGVGIGVAMGED